MAPWDSATRKQVVVAFGACEFTTGLSLEGRTTLDFTAFHECEIRARVYGVLETREETTLRKSIASECGGYRVWAQMTRNKSNACRYYPLAKNTLTPIYSILWRPVSPQRVLSATILSGKSLESISGWGMPPLHKLFPLTFQRNRWTIIKTCHSRDSLSWKSIFHWLLFLFSFKPLFRYVLLKTFNSLLSGYFQFS